MNGKLLFHRTEYFLKEAYRKDNIRYRSSTHCPVAQLIAANMGYIVWCGSWYNGTTEITVTFNWGSYIRCQDSLKDRFKLIRHIGLWQYLLHMRYVFATGYTCPELAKIEDAFEGSYKEKDKAPRDILKCLMAVFVVLKEIHQITDKDLPANKVMSHGDYSDAIIDRLVSRNEWVSGKPVPAEKDLLS